MEVAVTFVVSSAELDVVYMGYTSTNIEGPLTFGLCSSWVWSRAEWLFYVEIIGLAGLLIS